MRDEMSLSKVKPIFKAYTPDQIRIRRRLLGYHQYEIANLCGSTRQTINNIENGKTDKLSMRYLISACLDELTNRCEDETVKKLIRFLDSE